MRRLSQSRSRARGALVALSCLASLCASAAPAQTVATHRATAAPGAPGAPIALTMGTEPWIGYGPWYIAQARGFFAREGLNVTIVTFQQDADLNAALAAGKTQVANIATHTSIKLILNNHLRITPVLVLDDSEGADAMLGSSSIQRVQDLRGKTVAYEYGTTSDLLLHYALSQARIPASAVHTQNIPAADAATALVAGRVDAAVTYEPYISSVAGKGRGVHVVYSSKAVPGLIGDFTVVDNKFLAGHPAAVRALLRAWDDAMTYLSAHTADGVAIMARSVGSTPASLQSTLAGVKIYSIAQNKSLARGLIQSRYRLVNGVLRASGVVNGTLDPARTLNFSYLP